MKIELTTKEKHIIGAHPRLLDGLALEEATNGVAE